MAGPESRLAVVAALIGNLAIALLKLAAGLVANSAAMLAEAAHSFSDVGNQVLLLVGLKRSTAGPTEEHPYGMAKSAYFWSFLVAILLFGVAGAYSLLEGFEKLQHPHEIGDITLSLAVLGVAFAIEAAVLTIAYRQAKRLARERGITSGRQFLQENRDAALLTVLVEDTLALIGLPIAALALLLSAWTGDPVWDGLGSVVIGGLLMAFAAFLGKEVHDLILGRGLTPGEVATVRRVITSDPAVDGVVSLQSMYFSAHVALLGAEVDMKEDLHGRQVEEALLRLEQALIAALPQLKFVYLEPKSPAQKPEAEAAVGAHPAHEPAR